MQKQLMEIRISQLKEILYKHVKIKHMQYAIMKQQTAGSNDVWIAVYPNTTGDDLVSLVYASQEEATAKLIELQTNEPTLTQYRIESYPDNPNP